MYEGGLRIPRNKVLMKDLAIGIIVLFICMNVNPSIAVDTLNKSSIPTSNNNTLYVGGNGPVNYSKIQDAIDNASDGDTVFVFDDSSPYYENVVVNKRINLIGEDRNTTIISGIYGVLPSEVVYISHNNVFICDFTITGDIYGIDVWSNNNIIQGNRIVYNHWGIEIYGVYNIITNNMIIHNNDVGVFDDCRDSNNTVKWNVIGGNGDPDYSEGGIFKHRDGGYYHHNDIDLNWGNAHTEASYWGVWDDGSEGNYWGDWEKNPGYPDVYIIRGTDKDQIDWHPSATPYFNYPIVYIYNDYYAESGYPIHFSPYVNKPSSSVSWFWDFGDGNTSTEEDPYHSYTKSDIYNINVTVTNDQGISDTDRSIAYIGRPPNIPTISGPTTGKPRVSYNYSIVATDPDDGNLYYYIDWGPWMSDEYIGPYPAGEVVNVSYRWYQIGTFIISVYAVDEAGFESEWATLEVTIPKSKDVNLDLLLFKLLEKFPLLEKFLYLLDKF